MVLKKVIDKVYDFFEKEYYYIVASRKTDKDIWFSIFLEEYHDIEFTKFKENMKKIREDFKNSFMSKSASALTYLAYCIGIPLATIISAGSMMMFVVAYPGIIVACIFTALYLIFLWYYTKGLMFDYFKRD